MAAEQRHDEAPVLKVRPRTSGRMAFQISERISNMLNFGTRPELEGSGYPIAFKTGSAPASPLAGGLRQMRYSLIPILTKRFRSSKIGTTAQDRLIQNQQPTPKIFDSPDLREMGKPKTHLRPAAPIWQPNSTSAPTAATVNESAKRTISQSQKGQESNQQQAAASIALAASHSPMLITADAEKWNVVLASKSTSGYTPSATVNLESPQLDGPSPLGQVLTGPVATTTISFLEVPSEIRNLIYSFALSFSSPLKQRRSVNASCRNGSCALHPSPNVSELLCVGKQVYAEALPFLYRQNKFIFQNLKCFLEILERMEPSTVDEINCIILHKVPLEEAYLAWGEVGRFLTPSSRRSSLRALHRLFRLQITAVAFSGLTSIQAQPFQQAVLTDWDPVPYDRWRVRNWSPSRCTACDGHRQGAKLGGERTRSWEIGSIEEWKEEQVSLRSCTGSGGQFMDRVEVVLERRVRR